MKTINLQKEIMKLNKEELDEVIVAIKNRRVALNSQAMSSFYRGMKVQFGKKNGIRRLGTIESIGRTRAVVDTGIDKWRVPFSHLTEATSNKENV